VRRDHEEIISWLIREAGSTRLKATLGWSAVHSVMLEAARAAYRVESKILPGDVPGKECRVYRQRVGVVGVISPWNWPLQLSNRSVAPALAVGNAVVLKPASDHPDHRRAAPGQDLRGGRAATRGVERRGRRRPRYRGRDRLPSYPEGHLLHRLDPVGRRIGRLAVESPIIKRVDLELGGNSPMVVLDDADLDHAVPAAVFGKFLHQGQICMITNRFIVDERLHDAFIDGSRPRSATSRWGTRTTQKR
jgi:aldehyde dehydrogenase (NAD+)